MKYLGVCIEPSCRMSISQGSSSSHDFIQRKAGRYNNLELELNAVVSRGFIKQVAMVYSVRSVYGSHLLRLQALQVSRPSKKSTSRSIRPTFENHTDTMQCNAMLQTNQNRLLLLLLAIILFHFYLFLRYCCPTENQS